MDYFDYDFYCNVRDLVYDISFSGFPLDVFFNDIMHIEDERFNKDYALKDMLTICNFVQDLIDENKILRKRLENK